MQKITRLVLLIYGLLLSTNGFADDTDSVTAGIKSMLVESPYASRWQLYRPVEANTYPDRWMRPFAHIEFQDNSALGRISKLRNLSLLTLAETAGTRLFLGVNDDGLVGLHFVGLTGPGDERHVSVARMPYLKKKR